MVVNSLRSALELLKNIPGQLLESDVEVDPKAELAGVYRYVGAGGTVARPTKKGPAMIFNNVKRPPGCKGGYRGVGQPEAGSRSAGRRSGGFGKTAIS